MPLDLENLLFIDFEARSRVDITEVGAEAYAAHPSTEPLIACWGVGMTSPIQTWRRGEPLPEEWKVPRRWVAHNHETERGLLLRKLDFVVNDWLDTSSVTSLAGMPRNLHDVALALHLPIEKLSNKAMLQLAKPQRDGTFIERIDRPDLFEELEVYCARDVEVMRAIMVALPPYHWLVPPMEEQLFELTNKMNQRGLKVDVTEVALAQGAVNQHDALLRSEWETLVPGVNPRYPAGVAIAMRLPNVTKASVRDALKTATGPRKRALQLLATIKMASNAKLNALAQRTVDGHLHGAMVFHGAGRTGRWSSMGVQVHNFPHGLGVDTNTAVEALLAGVLEMLYENPTEAISGLLRGLIKGPLLSGDFSQIEARTLVGLAGQHDVLRLFAEKKDPYKVMAANIYNKPVMDINKDERFMGKQAVLGAGYGVGGRGFQWMLDETYDVKVSLEEAERVVYAYRAMNKKVVELWWGVEAFIKRVMLEQPQRMMTSEIAPRIAARMVKSWLVIKLPTGRCLWYFEPTLVTSDRGPQMMYWGRDINKGGAWGRVKTYGGKLVENITQAIARDIMAEAMLRVEAAGFHPIFTVHDEVVCQDPPERLEEFKSIMEQNLKWWPDLPLDVEVQATERYQK